jgi:hypothetical protein
MSERHEDVVSDILPQAAEPFNYTIETGVAQKERGNALIRISSSIASRILKKRGVPISIASHPLESLCTLP